MAQGFGSQQNGAKKKKFLSLAGEQLFSLDKEDSELQKEAKRQFEIVQQAGEDFNRACEILLCAYINKNGAGQIATSLDGKERKGWVVPIAATDETDRKVEHIKGGDRFQCAVALYEKACPIPPHQAMVVQLFENDAFKVVYRVRDDLKMGL